MSKVDVRDIVGITEIGLHAGVSTGAVTNWVSRYEEFPKPFKVLRCGPLYKLSEIDKWLKATGRKDK